MTCKKCDGKGWYLYDHNHGKPCEDCCTHPTNRRYVQSVEHRNPGTWTCGLCGTEFKADK